MRIKNLKNKPGFTLIEALFAVAVGVLFLAAVVSIWFYSTKSWKVQSVKTEIRFDIQDAMEKIKRDVQLADGGKILFYPSDASSYTAISIPGATPDGDGLFSFDDEGNISWDKTIIYHLYENELRRTVIDSFNATEATRQEQLDDVVDAGEGGDDSETTTLFAADTTTLAISPTNPTFDGYGTEGLSGNTTFGNVSLTSGNHTIQFKITDQNSSSDGFRLGLDHLSLAPSGSVREAEDLTVSTSTGQTIFPETGDLAWSGNYQLEYQAGALNNSITFQVYYDQWTESNFDNMTHSDTEVTGTNPVLTVASRETQGMTPGWTATSQTGVSDADNNSSGTPDPAINGMTIRNIILGSSMAKAGQMVRLKFAASSTGTLVISEAYFGERSADNFVDGTTTQLYFNNGTAGDGEDAGEVGAVGIGGPAGISIPPGEHAWTNWFIPVNDIADPSATDYLVSFVVDASAANADESYWDAGSGTHSYMETGSTALDTWNSVTDLGYAEDPSIHAVEEIGIWFASGTATSQIYDTTLSSPAYGQLSWSTENSGTFSLKARSSDSSEMTDATDWASVTDHTSSPSSLSIGNGRFVQFQATLTAAEPYTAYPEIDTVGIKWPGQTSVVQISGVYTKRPNYGIFSVFVDGVALTKALDITLTAVKEYQGTNYDYALSASIDCRNTSL